MTGRTRDAATLAAGTLVSRLLGLLRDLLVASVLGPAADAFVLAFRLPNFFRRLLAEGSLGLAYAAAEAGIKKERGPGEASAFARAVSLRLFLLALPACLLLVPLTPALAFLLAPGAQTAILDRGAALLRLCLPYLPLSLVAAIAFTHAAGAGNFRPQAWAPALLNIPILFAGAAALLLHTGRGAAETLLCLGIVAGGIAQAALGLRCLGVDGKNARPPSLGRSGIPFFSAPPEVGAFLKKMPASALGGAPHQLHILAGMAVASFMAPGGISALYFAERLIELPLGIAGAAVGIAALPGLAADAARGHTRDFREHLARSMGMSAFFSLPAAAGLFSLALPLCRLLFGHGAYAGEPVAITAAALQGYALGLPALCAARPLLAAANALGLERVPLETAVKSMGVLVIGSLAGLMLASAPVHTAFCMGLGLGAGALANAWLLLRRVGGELARRGRTESGTAGTLRDLLPGAGRYAAAALLMGAGLLPLGAAGGPGTAVLLLVIALCAGLWCGGWYLLRSPEARELASFFICRSQ